MDSVSALAIAPQLIATASPTVLHDGTLNRGNTTHIQSRFNSVVATVNLANQTGSPLNSEELTTLINSKLVPALTVKPQSERAVDCKLDAMHEQLDAMHDQLDAIHDQGVATLQVAIKVLDLQKQMNDRLILIQSKSEAILT